MSTQILVKACLAPGIERDFSLTRGELASLKRRQDRQHAKGVIGRLGDRTSAPSTPLDVLACVPDPHSELGAGN